ncbi:hypothetical protein M2275_006719 [Rhodococcus opacus]|jgi:hypothetical protein|nr:hypothetical protein [Rhodococcus opacus]
MELAPHRRLKWWGCLLIDSWENKVSATNDRASGDPLCSFHG